MSIPLCFNFNWEAYPESAYPSIAREYLDHGIDTFVFVEPWITKGLEQPEFIDFLRGFAQKMGIRFVSMHAAAGPKYDLNIPETDRRPGMIQDHLRSMAIAAEFGSKTYTVHVGAYHHCVKHIPVKDLRPNAIETLEKLVPEAERLGIVIAVENSFEPPNTPQEVIGLVNHFGGNPAIGVCYDTGHAHLMSPYPWKKRECYEPYMFKQWWQNGIIEEAHALDIVCQQVVTTHIHDNSGYGDLHSMPFDGTLDWDELMPKLFRNCPRMLEYQTEINFQDGKGWAGESLAPVGGYSIKRQVEVFRKLGFSF